MARVNVQTHIALITLKGISPGTAPLAQGPALRPLSKRLLKSIIAAAFCLGSAVCVQAQSPQQSGGDESWTTTRDTTSQYANSSRTTESHTKSGNRTVDKQRMEFLGPNGGYKPTSETETETVQVDATTTRTVVRTYQWDGNGQRTLARVSEQESRTTAGGGVRTENKISASDGNGHFQVIRREVADTKTVSPGVEETKSTVYQRDSYGGFSQAEQTQEVKTHAADDSVAVKKTTLMPDGNGSWKVSDVTEKTIKADGKDRTTEERVSRPDLDGRLQERSRTVTKEGETATGEKTNTVESYSVFSPGYSDNSMHLSQRVTSIQKKGANGETIDQQIEEPSGGNPSDGAKVSGRAKYVVKYAAPGTQQTTQGTKTFEARDANGNIHVASTETEKSTRPAAQAPAKQKSDAAADKPQEKPPAKP
jgi:hypothetical protein